MMHDLALTNYTIGIASPAISIRRRLTVKRIQEVVADYYGISVDEMVSARQSRNVSHPRQLAMYLTRNLTPKSLPDIGGRFGGRDHTTVMHALKAVAKRIEADAEYAFDASHLQERLTGCVSSGWAA